MRPLPLLTALAAFLSPAAALAQASPSPFTSATRYDAMRRVTGTISADPDTVGSGNPFLAVRNSYDAAGRLTKVETGTLSAWQSETVAPANWTGFSVSQTLETAYDAMDRKVRDLVREGAAGTVRKLTQYSYDSMGRLDCTAVRMNPALFASPPASACTLGTAGSDGPDRIVRNLYDAAGQRLQLREGVGTSVEAAEATWEYDLNGQVTTVIDGNGNRASLSYDGHGRKARWTFPSTTKPTAYNDSTPATALATAGSVNAADYEAYGYDAAGNRTSFRKRDGSTLTYSYDALNRMSVKVVPERQAPLPFPLSTAQTRDVYYAYDLRGLQTEADFDSLSGEGLTTGHDGFGRPVSNVSTMGGTSRTLAYQHDRNGSRTELTWPDGIKMSFVYDGLNRMIDAREGALGSTASIGAIAYKNDGARDSVAYGGNGTSYGYDAVGRLNSLADTFSGTTGNITSTFSHNSASQIASTTRNNDSYAWDGHYNVNRAYASNGLNQYTAAGSTSIQYDANGNLVQSGSSTYVYDIENRLVQAGAITLVYDPLGRLFQISGGSGGTTRFLYDGDELVAEYDSNGVVQHRYVHGAGADDPIAWYVGADLTQRRSLHPDHQGSIAGLSQGSGTLLAVNRYDEYGIPAATNLGRFQYTGQAWIPELGMYYYKARIYSPTLGRFMQTDPVGYEDQINLYAYVGNDPMNQADPSGRKALIVTDPDGIRVVIIPVRFTGTGATPTYVTAAIESFNSTNIEGGGYRIMAVATNTPIGGVLNSFRVEPGAPSECGGPSACVNHLGGSKGYADSESGHAIDSPAHEFPHFAGVQDRYDEHTDPVTGDRFTTPQENYENNSMGNLGKRSLNQEQMGEIESNSTTKQCQGSSSDLENIEC